MFSSVIFSLLFLYPSPTQECVQLVKATCTHSARCGGDYETCMSGFESWNYKGACVEKTSWPRAARACTEALVDPETSCSEPPEACGG